MAVDGYEPIQFFPTEIDFDPMTTPPWVRPAPGAGAETRRLLDYASPNTLIPYLLASDDEAHGPTFFLVPRCDEVRRYRPLDGNPGAFLEFAKTECNPGGVLKFANRFGLLDSRGDVETLAGWYASIREMYEAVVLWRDCQRAHDLSRLVSVFNERQENSGFIGPAGSLTAFLGKTDDPARLALRLEPPTLLEALWLQFAMAVSGNTNFRKCDWCDEWFAYGTGTGRRNTAKFCKPACRQAAFVKRQQEAET